MRGPVVAVAPHDASYEDPIRLRAGDRLRLTGRADVWDGYRWLWAVCTDGREGWIPDDLPTPDGRARVDFDARELTLPKGEAAEALRSRHGWVWCRRADGAEGWVPARALRRAEERSE